MKVAVITGRYPSHNAPYNHMFVHTRNQQYVKTGVSVKVFVPSGSEHRYQIDNIKVQQQPANEIVKEISDGQYDAIFIHLLHHSINPTIDGGPIYEYVITHDIPCLFFIHGVEVQKLSRSRPGDIRFSKPKSVARAIYRDLWVLNRTRRTITKIINETRNTRFVFVSEWIREDAERTFELNLRQRSEVIHNGIDTELFYFQDRWKDRHKLLAIRPLVLRGTYAVDLAIDAMSKVKDKNISLTIIGKGPEKKDILNYIAKRRASSVIHVTDKFLAHSDIPTAHSHYGIYFAATRMDSQGVSMCEAMASGLPVISFNTCAIPEFVNHNSNGLLLERENSNAMPVLIDELLSNKNTYYRLAEGGRHTAESIDIRHTTAQEIELAKSTIISAKYH
ncbi:glycosyltransferase family 4 protein [Parahaliea sp. F7430]|uniref:Glycosyltransferase family 4 protein n=1 Tax=Sediminihaliea albiluteola TaxID=2758564 RepID=A0A7W2TY52_9GAMM|nr:glycosyltransferase family 4 protein [Sediminihaliea albiluteola]MBA6414071.1 glycosyltransferase family 4 protein [Sediminihaliea albiluteola]